MDMIDELEYKKEIKDLKNHIMELSLKISLKDEKIRQLEEELQHRPKSKKRKFSPETREIIKMRSMQKDEGGNYPTIRAMAKEFNCSIGLIHSIIAELK